MRGLWETPRPQDAAEWCAGASSRVPLRMLDERLWPGQTGTWIGPVEIGSGVAWNVLPVASDTLVPE
jgi:hypothetical protein